MDGNDCDVIVVGGGPAGSTVSYLLAEKGFNVFLFEKDSHPRFHIGESLLPSNILLFKKLGILPEIEEIGIPKYGAEFNKPNSAENSTFYFKETVDGYPPAFEVVRAQLDLLLIENAISKGVKVFQDTRVLSVDLGAKKGPRAIVKNPNGSETPINSLFFIDSSGQDTFLANTLKLKIQNRRHKSASIYGHFKGVERREGKDEGNISIYWFPHGWFWVIPFKNGDTSVGVVCWPQYLKTRGGLTIEEFFDASIKLCPNLSNRMRNAEAVNSIRTIGNYSYSSRKSYGKNYILIGDARTFLDPIFSSGIFIAMKSAFLAAESVEAWLKKSDNSSMIFKKNEKMLNRGLRNLSWIVQRVTAPAMQDMFLYHRNIIGVDDSVVSLLSGNIFNMGIKNNIFYFLFKLIYYYKSLFGIFQYFDWRSEKKYF
jgi:flavin-dependent dehydrogenase